MSSGSRVILKFYTIVAGWKGAPLSAPYSEATPLLILILLFLLHLHHLLLIINKPPRIALYVRAETSG